MKTSKTKPKLFKDLPFRLSIKIIVNHFLYKVKNEDQLKIKARYGYFKLDRFKKPFLLNISLLLKNTHKNIFPKGITNLTVKDCNNFVGNK